MLTLTRARRQFLHHEDMLTGRKHNKFESLRRDRPATRYIELGKSDAGK